MNFKNPVDLIVSIKYIYYKLLLKSIINLKLSSLLSYIMKSL